MGRVPTHNFVWTIYYFINKKKKKGKKREKRRLNHSTHIFNKTNKLIFMNKKRKKKLCKGWIGSCRQRMLAFLF